MKLRDDIVLYGKLAAAELGYSTCRIEVTSGCFQKCRGCVSWRDHANRKMNASLNLTKVQELIIELCRFSAFEHLTFTGGDPQAWFPINDFLRWWTRGFNHSGVRFQISTALAKPISEPELWNCVDRYLISLDAASPEIYSKMRGDRDNNMQTILEHAKVLTEPQLGFMITVRKENQCEVVSVIQCLDRMYRTSMPNIRKVQVLASIGSLKGDLDNKFWDKWQTDKEFIAKTIDVPVSFCDEDIVETREICAAKETESIQCWTSRLSAHIKPNGDVYPCCLIGGEAIDIHESFKLGNIFENSLKKIYQSYPAKQNYRNVFCKKVCQYKQLQINLAGGKAAGTILSIP